MKVRELIEKLLERNELDDEIMVEWFDKKHFIEDVGFENLFGDIENMPSVSDLDKVWRKVVDEGQECLSWSIISGETEQSIEDIIREELIGEDND